MCLSISLSDSIKDVFIVFNNKSHSWGNQKYDRKTREYEKS